MLLASQNAMSGKQDEALTFLADAIDRGFITSYKISKEFPFFKELDGNAEYEAIQLRMREHLDLERNTLGLQPISPST
jgi:hypothetical protein